MAKSLKKRDFPLNVERLFSAEGADAFDLIHFHEIEPASDETPSAFETPDNWHSEAAALLSESAACHSMPANTRSVEENTVPSWLWRHTSDGRLRSGENSAKQVFSRVAGAAAYAGWKKDVFTDEAETRAFFDEIRYALAQRFIAIDPAYLATAGLDWAYGIEKKPQSASEAKKKTALPISNASIDALLGGNKSEQEKWRKLLAGGAKSGVLECSFSDIAGDWGTGASRLATNAAIDVFAFRRDIGGIDIDRLCHAVKILVIALELQNDRAGGGIAIGLHNITPALMRQGIAYDSNAGRATAAALAAIVTAEAYVVSAQLASLLGPSLDFAANRESLLRAMRNHRRAAYGDMNDYEKMSVVPAPLLLDRGADLALIAAARRRWDDVLEIVPQHGLRFTQVTDFSPVAALAFFMESATQGVQPMPGLTRLDATEPGIYRRELHPAVAEALVKLRYKTETRKAIATYVGGTHSLEHAPVINHVSLRKLGFDAPVLEKIEAYLASVTDIRFAFTPWIIGEEFYRDTLKIPEDKFEDMSFDLLAHLGFSDANIKAANAYCYGTGSIQGAPGLSSAHAGIFATSADISTEAHIRMAAAVQSFISGNAGLQLLLTATIADSEPLLLSAWRYGLKSVSLEAASGFADIAETRTAAPGMPKPVMPTAGVGQYASPSRSALRNRPKASGELVGMKPSGKSHGSRKPGSRGKDS